MDVKRFYINIGLLDFKKHFVVLKEKIPYKHENTPESLKQLMDIIKAFIKEQTVAKDKIVGIGINLSGRIIQQVIVIVIFIFTMSRLLPSSRRK